MAKLAARTLPKFVLYDLLTGPATPPPCSKKMRTAYLTAPHLHPVKQQTSQAFVLPPLPWLNRTGDPSPSAPSETPLVFTFNSGAQAGSSLKNALAFVGERHSFKLVSHPVTWETREGLETLKPENMPALAIVEGTRPNYLADAVFLSLLNRAIPVLVDSRAVSPWLVKRGRGFCTADDEQDWILVLDKTLGNPSFRRVLGQDGRDWINRHMNQRVYEAKLLAFLEKFVNGS